MTATSACGRVAATFTLVVLAALSSLAFVAGSWAGPGSFVLAALVSLVVSVGGLILVWALDGPRVPYVVVVLALGAWATVIVPF